jgi:hypothetical protein
MIVALGLIVFGQGALLWQVAATQQQGWQVSDLDAGPSREPDIAIDANGNALAVWLNEQRVRTSTFSIHAGSWSPAITLSNPNDSSSAPRVASNAAGEAVAVWRGMKASNASPYIALSRYSPATGAWNIALELPTNGYWPRAVIDAHGNTIVVWSEFLRANAYYDDEVHEIRSVRYDAATATWSAPVAVSDEHAWGLQLGTDGAGNVTVVWSRWGSTSCCYLESARLSTGSHQWSGVTRLWEGQLFPNTWGVVADHAGNVTTVWSEFPGSVYSARLSADTATWSAAITVATANAWDPGASLGVDATGNVTAVYGSGVGPIGTVWSISYSEATNTWSAPSNIAINVVSGSARLAVDPPGNATVVWLLTGGAMQVARRPAGGLWSTLAAVGGSPITPRIASDRAGTTFVLWGRRAAPPALQAARLTATVAAPAIGHVTSTSGALTIEFAPPLVVEPGYAVLNYEYSLDNGAAWTPRTPASPNSPVVISGLIDGLSYTVRLRPVNATGPGVASDAAILTPGLTAPANLRVATMVGNLVTLAWAVPSSSVLPTGYLLEGGSSPGSVAATISTPGLILTFPAPNGIFYVRARGTLGRVESEPSNEIAINVGVPAPPSAPTNLLGHADGSTVALTWQNTVAGGAATGIVLDVSGHANGSISLPLTDRFTFAVVLSGTYSVAVRAINASGSSPQSNPVTLTFPGTCSAPLTPTNLAAAKNGSTVFLAWSPPAAGAAPTEYSVLVSGSFNGSITTSGLTFSSSAPPGTYSLSVAATNACGTSAATPETTIAIP